MNRARQTVWHPAGHVLKDLCLLMFVLCHDRRACLLHISLNELLDAQELQEKDGGRRVGIDKVSGKGKDLWCKLY